MGGGGQAGRPAARGGACAGAGQAPRPARLRPGGRRASPAVRVRRARSGHQPDGADPSPAVVADGARYRVDPRLDPEGGGGRPARPGRPDGRGVLRGARGDERRPGHGAPAAAPGPAEHRDRRVPAGAAVRAGDPARDDGPLRGDRGRHRAGPLAGQRVGAGRGRPRRRSGVRDDELRPAPLPSGVSPGSSRGRPARRLRRLDSRHAGDGLGAGERHPGGHRPPPGDARARRVPDGRPAHADADHAADAHDRPGHLARVRQAPGAPGARAGRVPARPGHGRAGDLSGGSAALRLCGPDRADPPRAELE